jgi:hypothetical protein
VSNAATASARRFTMTAEAWLMTKRRWFIAFWIVLAVFWTATLVLDRPYRFGFWGHSTTAIVGLVTAALGIFTQVRLAAIR